MNSIVVSKAALYRKMKEIHRSDMDYVRVSICNEALDQSSFFPSFLHFDAFKADGSHADFESVDSLLRVVK